MSQPIIKISDGHSYGLFIIGLGIGGLAIYSFRNNSIILGLVLTLVSISLLLPGKGTWVDVENKKVKKYITVFFIKFGSWKSISGYSKLGLWLTNESLERAPFKTMYTKTYDIYFSNEDGSRRMEFQEFTDYPSAKKCLHKFAELLNLEVFDEAEEIMSAIAKRRDR